MDKKYLKTNEINLRKIVKGFFSYLDEVTRDYALEIVDIENLPVVGKEVSFRVNTDRVVIINYTDDRYKCKEVHVAIPIGTTLRSGWGFSFGELHTCIATGITAKAEDYEIIRDETVRFEDTLAELGDVDGRTSVKSLQVAELSDCSTSLYFNTEDGILTIELTTITPRTYSTIKARFLDG